jgi:hypothetical protein
MIEEGTFEALIDDSQTSLLATPEGIDRPDEISLAQRPFQRLYRKRRFLSFRTTVQDRESSHPSIWPPVLGQNTLEGERSYRHRHAGTRRTLGGKCGRWA